MAGDQGSTAAGASESLLDAPSMSGDRPPKKPEALLGGCQTPSPGRRGLIEKIRIPKEARGDVQGQGVATGPQEGLLVDQDGTGTSQGDIQAYPVFKAVPNTGQVDRHAVIAWKVVRDLQTKVAQYGLGSPEFMQIIRVMNTYLLAPFDIKHLGQVLFQPVQFTVFESNWRKMAERVAAEDTHLPQDDPRYAVGVDVLMGTNQFFNPDLQATWHPLILEQAQKVGMGAVVKSIDMGAPKTRYVKISQGQKEQFFSFV